MGAINVEARENKKTNIMVKCFECYAEHGLGSVGIKGLAQACGISSGNLYFYFENLDDLIIQSTEYCMSKVEDDFMAKAPANVSELWGFIDEIPYWTAREHGKKYRLMYQIYTHPKYREYGQKFFKDADKRYIEYAKQLEGKLGIPYEKLTGLIYILIRASVHYALFEDEFYLKSQIAVLKESLELLTEKYKTKAVFASYYCRTAVKNSQEKRAAYLIFGLVERPGSTNKVGKCPAVFCGRNMKELSIFIDESGDFGEYSHHSPFYIVTMVFRNQNADDICTFKLLGLKRDKRILSKAEIKYFNGETALKKDYLRHIQKKKYNLKHTENIEVVDK